MKKGCFSWRLLFLMLLSMAVLCGAAAEELMLDVTLQLPGMKPHPAEVFVLRLAAEDETAPMPNGAAGGVLDAAISGEGIHTLPQWHFDEPGEYRYTLRQLSGGAKCTVDARVYEVTIYARRSGRGIAFTPVYRVQGRTEKTEEIVFVNRYPEPQPLSDLPLTSDESHIPEQLAAIAVLLVLAAGLLTGYFRMRRANDAARAAEEETEEEDE